MARWRRFCFCMAIKTSHWPKFWGGGVVWEPELLFYLALPAYLPTHFFLLQESPQRTEIFNDNWTYFLFHYTFSCQNISSIYALVLHTKGLQVDADLYTRTRFFHFNHSPKAINSLITQSACVYLDLLLQVKWMLTEIYAGNQYFIQ
jgi:hypothetical protein